MYTVANYVPNKTPLMADLPAERLDNQSFPFIHVAMDCFCPFVVKKLRRSMKR